MDWVVLLKDVLLPVLTVLLAGFSAYIGANRGRTAAYREKLYDKQLLAYSELVSLAIEVLTTAMDASGTAEKPRPWGFLTRFLTISVYVPLAIRNSFTRLVAAYGRFVENDSADAASALLEELHDAFFQVIDAVLDHVGTERLSQETLGLIGQYSRQKRRLL